MEGAMYTEWILDTIDQLRKRKARPDLERICHMVERKHGPSFADIAAELDKLVEAQVVVKVDYKGSTSYRNAAKWRKSHFGNVQNSSSSSAKLDAAVRALRGSGTGETDSGGDDSGGDGDAVTENAGRAATAAASLPPASQKPVARESIEQWLLEQDPNTKLKGNTLQVALDREVEAYHLEKIGNGTYIIGDPSKKPPPPEKERAKGPKSSKPKPAKPKTKKISAPETPTMPTGEAATVVSVTPETVAVSITPEKVDPGPEASKDVSKEQTDAQPPPPNKQTEVQQSPIKSPVKVPKEKLTTPSKKGRPPSAKRKVGIMQAFFFLQFERKVIQIVIN